MTEEIFADKRFIILVGFKSKEDKTKLILDIVDGLRDEREPYDCYIITDKSNKKYYGDYPAHFMNKYRYSEDNLIAHSILHRHYDYREKDRVPVDGLQIIVLDDTIERISNNSKETYDILYRFGETCLENKIVCIYTFDDEDDIPSDILIGMVNCPTVKVSPNKDKYENVYESDHVFSYTYDAE